MLLSKERVSEGTAQQVSDASERSPLFVSWRMYIKCSNAS